MHRQRHAGASVEEKNFPAVRISWVLSRAELAGDFRLLGLVPGDTVMVHASVKSVGEVAGGPDQIHLAIKDALTDTGTMMMYASCPDYYDDVGRGVYPGSTEREILEKMPPFDPLTARAARDNGTLVEFFRTYPGSLVNNHVARFVAWGAQARHLISEQPWDFPFGKRLRSRSFCRAQREDPADRLRSRSTSPSCITPSTSSTCPICAS